MSDPRVESFDAIIVGGGPAGSTCARQLVGAGWKTLVVDEARFPRVKLCAGWITPPVLTALEIDPEAYRREHTLEDFHGFNIWRLSGRETLADYGRVVSYGVVRSELDHYLLGRSGAEVVEGVKVGSIWRDADGVVVNGRWSAPLLIGAGGHTCPVARHLGVVLRKEKAISTLELELEPKPSQMKAVGVDPAYPEIVFFDDIRGYGWCFRKGRFLNIGVGRTRPQHLREHLTAFLERLREKAKIPADCGFEDSDFRGHAYKLHHVTPRPYFDARVLLVGDAAGLSYNFSGEGIRPAVESALFAARVACGAGGDFSRNRLELYRDLLWNAYGKPVTGWKFRAMEALPPQWFRITGCLLLSIPPLARNIVIERFFLHGENR
jgi:flavin-dependent dehydrogenase